MHNRPGLPVGQFAIRSGPTDGRRRLLRHPGGRQGRPWRPAGSRHRPGAGRRATSPPPCSPSSPATCRRWTPRSSASPRSMAGDAYNVIPQTVAICAAPCASSATETCALIETGSGAGGGRRRRLRRHRQPRLPAIFAPARQQPPSRPSASPMPPPNWSGRQGGPHRRRAWAPRISPSCWSGPGAYMHVGNGDSGLGPQPAL